MMKSNCYSVWFVAGLLAVALTYAVGQDRPKGAPKRVRPPKFDPAKVSEYFFEDVFSKVVGERPAKGDRPPAVANAASTPTPNSPNGSALPTGEWAKLISPTTIEDEIKAIKLEVAKNITTPSEFAGRGHKAIRREFSVLAMLFAIITEYEGEVRFKRDAAAARNAFARTANNTKAGGNSNVFGEAKARKADLDELLNGASIAASGPGDTPDWATIIDRAPLMQRLETAYQTRLTPALSNQGEFSKSAETVLHEAELIAAMAAVLTKPGMSDSEDETYAGFANSMKEGASELTAAVKQSNYEQARTAAGKIDKACSQCHESYR